MNKGVGVEVTEVQRVILARAERLRRYVERKIPKRFRGILAAEDVLQDVWIVAFRTISPEIENVDSWLTALTNSKLIDTLRAARTRKRGGDWQPLRQAAQQRASFDSLFKNIRARVQTPSREVSAQEARHAVQVALGRLPEDMRQAVCLCHIEGHSRRDVARIMCKTEPAINSLLYRALNELRACVGEAAQFFSDAKSVERCC
ncbi:MAG: RNA polymerase sigma factor [Phycisphaerae bacterium]|nr:RNA polymerase sigma factor [Phycisphaerae bacterium]